MKIEILYGSGFAATAAFIRSIRSSMEDHVVDSGGELDLVPVVVGPQRVVFVATHPLGETVAASWHRGELDFTWDPSKDELRMVAEILARVTLDNAR